MSFDLSFIRGTSTHGEAASNAVEPRNEPQRVTIPLTPKNATTSPAAAYTAKQLELLETAREIIMRNRLSREITEGAMLQLEKDLAEKKDLANIVLYLSEALDRSSGGGDRYIKRAIKALEENGYKA